ncbi:peroxiredoxin-2 [Drosophila albomicans]|uniref:thioredoxin-dependent peroxiredoxin n=1 Tax=Drosophila albomicans TaxID=7291 RepID=A0A6P8WXW8_DROAB|nr:peroxiredoxin-2 [Drosophila albomicans]
MSLLLRKPAPDFSTIAVTSSTGFRSMTLHEFRGRYVILLFYPADFSFVCPTELQAFSDRAQEFRSVGCEIIACSTDSQYAHCVWIMQPRKQGGLGDMDIPLLADKSMKIAQSYGMLDESTGLAHRGMFIIDRVGIVRHISVNDIGVGRSVEESLRLVQAYQFTDEFGEVCPANWRPGAKTFKSTNASKAEYFKGAG